MLALSQFYVEICNPSELHMHSLAAGTSAHVLDSSPIAASLLNKDQVPSLKPCYCVASYRNVLFNVSKSCLSSRILSQVWENGQLSNEHWWGLPFILLWFQAISIQPLAVVLRSTKFKRNLQYFMCVYAAKVFWLFGEKKWAAFWPSFTGSFCHMMLKKLQRPCRF